MEDALLERIDNLLKKMDRKQRIRFAWLCTVRVLPFLAYRNNTEKPYFYYWGKDANKHISSIFRVIDAILVADPLYITETAPVARFAAQSIIPTTAPYVTIDYIRSIVIDAAIDTSINIKNNHPTAFITAIAARLIVTTAIDATTDVAVASRYLASLNSYPTDIDASVDAARYTAAIATDNNSSYTIASNHLIDLNKFNDCFYDILLMDAEEILANKPLSNKGVDIYRYLWYEFENALESIDAGYWARLYKEIFDNGFELNKAELLQRINLQAEILEGGASGVASYLEELEKGSTRLSEVRIILMGDKGAGKTSLARRLQDPNAKLPTIEESTKGVDMKVWQPIRRKNIRAHIWDFAGHAITHAAHKLFLSQRCIYLIVLDGRRETSPIYWLEQVKLYTKDSHVFIIENLKDEHIPNTPFNELSDKYKIAGHMSLSIKQDKQKLKELTKLMIDFISKNMTDPFPESYDRIRTELEERFGKHEIHYINKDDFGSLAIDNGINNVDDVLTFFSNLGICIWYKDSKLNNLNTLVLNPCWITTAIYSILNWMSNNRKYEIELVDLKYIFKDDKNYPKTKFTFLFDLLQMYKLGYSPQDGILVIPYLLNLDRPDHLPDLGERTLKIRYRLDVPFPPDVMSRFIVALHQEIDGEKVWRNGVVLKKGDIHAIVRKDDRQILINVSGNNKNSQKFLNTCQEEMSKIIKTYKIDNNLDLDYFIKVYNKEGAWISQNTIKASDNEGYFYKEILRIKDMIEKQGNEAKVNISISGDVVGSEIIGINNTNNTIQQIQEKNDELQNILCRLILLMEKSNQSTEEIKNILSALEDLENKDVSVYKQNFFDKALETLKSTGQVLTGINRIEEYVGKAINLITSLSVLLN